MPKLSTRQIEERGAAIAAMHDSAKKLRLAKREVGDDIRHAHSLGVSWTRIGDTYGISHHTAQRRADTW